MKWPIIVGKIYKNIELPVYNGMCGMGANGRRPLQMLLHLGNSSANI